MRLLSVYDTPEAISVLWQLLSERTPEQSISHKVMPTEDQHRAFVAGRPYQAWYLIEAVVDMIDCVAVITKNVGAVYLTRNREIGIGILKQFQRNGYAKHAIEAIMARHSGQFLANINPENTASIALFRSFGFKHLQNTYALEA